ncbi:aminotransferase class V-fold PLP-dependent enzyme, partial [Arthrospira platensis SPKY1]|nr:aminotransferase class V-fold PLP-dependent enzyme [Arthrospira platensis SPKY1]
MLPYFHELPGNAASRNHAPGWLAADAVQQAREQLAQLIGADPREIVFTSGATEACHLAIKGVFEQYRRKGSHFITLRTEHKAVLEAYAQLERLGASVTYLDVDEQGR